MGESACTSTAYLGGVKANAGTLGVTAAVPRGDCDLSTDSRYTTKRTNKYYNYCQGRLVYPLFTFQSYCIITTIFPSLNRYHVDTVLTWAQDAGKATGLVTTTRITHASPAGHYAHTAERDWEGDSDFRTNKTDTCLDIAYQLVHTSPGKNCKVCSISCWILDSTVGWLARLSHPYRHIALSSE